MSRTRARRLRAALVTAVAASLVAFWTYFHVAPPGTALHLVHPDPETAYLVSSLAVFKGHPYVYVQHPGTPLQVLGSMLLALTYPFRAPAPEGFVVASLQHAGAFMVLAHLLLLLANVACMVALGFKALSVRRGSDALMAAAVAASFFAFLPRSFTTAFFWSHNAVAFPAGTTLWLVALLALRRGRPLTTRTALGLGLGVGALAATQLYFATWAAGLALAAAMVASRSGAAARTALRAPAILLAAAAAGFVVSVLPMLPSRALFFQWLGFLASHQGLYGRGPRGFLSWQSWSGNIASLYGWAPALFVATGLVFAMLLATRRSRGRRRAALWAVAAGSSLQWLLTLALFGKHASPSYLPALAALLPPLLVVAFLAGRRTGSGRLVSAGAAAAVLIAFVYGAALSFADHRRRIAFRAEMDREVQRHLAGYAARRGIDPRWVLLLWGPGLPDAACYGLWAGNLYSSSLLHGEVSRACPDQGLVWSNTTVVPEGWQGRRKIAGLLVTTEETPRRFPAFAAFGPPELSEVRDPAGVRLAFFPVVIRDGMARAAPR